MLVEEQIKIGEECGLVFTGEIDFDSGAPQFIGDKYQFKKYYDRLDEADWSIDL